MIISLVIILVSPLQVSIGHIVPGGAADQDRSICTGDEIVGVDGEMVLGASHHRVVQLMSAAATHGRVTLTLRRRTQNPSGMLLWNLYHSMFNIV